MNRAFDRDDQKTARIFLSYSRKDHEEVEKLYHRLEGAGYRPWMDDKDILPGMDWERELKKSVESCDFFIVCLSEHSIDRRGDIQREIGFALKKFEGRLAEDIYIIPVRLDSVEIPESIGRFQWVDLFAPDGFHRLKKSIETQGFPGINEPATPPAERTKTVGNIRNPVFDRIMPCYLLDDSYHFLDWNAAFDEIVAKPLGLRRGGHAFEFVEKLSNCADVIERSKEVFGPGEDPLVDIEVLHLDSDRYGLLMFQKLACQIPDDEGNTLAWSVNLNILVAEQHRLVFEDIYRRLERELNWSRYAQSYDRLLLQFDSYHRLLKTVTDLVDGSRRCIDLGAGTGNSTRALLDRDPQREIWAVELNQDMVEALRSNFRDENAPNEVDVNDSAMLDQVGRVTIVKDDIHRLDDLPQNYFDAALLLNVLYATDDPRRCLQQAWGLLRHGGVIALSTSHSETDVDRLFAAMRREFQVKGIFKQLEPAFEAAQHAHEKMSDRILRDSKSEIRGYLESTGFQIDEWLDDQYEGSVVVVKAVKV